MYWPQHMMNFGWGGWLIGALFMLIFWGGLIALVAYSVRAFSGTHQKKEARGTTGEGALEILQQRYAKGEIDKAEYEAMRRDIER